MKNAFKQKGRQNRPPLCANSYLIPIKLPQFERWLVIKFNQINFRKVSRIPGTSEMKIIKIIEWAMG